MNPACCTWLISCFCQGRCHNDVDFVTVQKRDSGLSFSRKDTYVIASYKLHVARTPQASEEAVRAKMFLVELDQDLATVKVISGGQAFNALWQPLQLGKTPGNDGMYCSSWGSRYQLKRMWYHRTHREPVPASAAELQIASTAAQKCEVIKPAGACACVLCVRAVCCVVRAVSCVLCLCCVLSACWCLCCVCLVPLSRSSTAGTR